MKVGYWYMTHFLLWSRLHKKQTVPDKTDLTVDKSDLIWLGTFKSTSSRLPKSTPRSAYGCDANYLIWFRVGEAVFRIEGMWEVSVEFMGQVEFADLLQNTDCQIDLICITWNAALSILGRMTVAEIVNLKWPTLAAINWVSLLHAAAAKLSINMISLSLKIRKLWGIISCKWCIIVP